MRESWVSMRACLMAVLVLLTWACGPAETSPSADSVADIAMSDDTDSGPDSQLDVTIQDATVDTDEPSIPVGGWSTGGCAEDIAGNGNKAGKVAYDFTQNDQFGQTLRLYDFCHQAVLLVGAAYW
jgi:hypothetical protein